MLASRLWRLSEAGEPAYLLGRNVEPADAALFDVLLRRGVIRHAGRQTSWDTCDGCNCGRDDRAIREIAGVPVAICVTDRNRDQVLQPDDLVTFTLSIADLVTAATESMVSARPELVASDIWRVQSLADGSAVYIAPTRRAADQAELLAILRHINKASPMLLLSPAMNARRQADLASGAVYQVSIAERISTSPTRTIALDLSMPACSATAQPRLELLQATRTIKFDGRIAKFPARPYELLVFLAQRLLGGAPLVSAADIYLEMFGSGTSDGRARDLVRETRQRLRAVCAAPKDLIQTRSNQGYCIDLPAKEVRISP